MQPITVQLKILPHGEGLPVPKYQTIGSAGMDIYSAESRTVGKGETALVKTGISVAIPDGFEIQVRSRSGMASRGIFVTNSPGTIDSDYRGEIGVILTNLSDRTFGIGRGDRIAQLLIAPVNRIHFEEVEELSATVRGDGGYGSTGA